MGCSGRRFGSLPLALMAALLIGICAAAQDQNGCGDRPQDEAEQTEESGCLKKGRRALFTWSFLTGNEVEYEDPADSPLDLDRPDFTEASTTVGRGLTVLEYGYTFTRADRRNTEHSLPETLLRVGLFADWFEFRIADNFVSQRGTDPVAPISAAGLEDLYIGSKFQLFMQDGWLPEAVLIPNMTLPTGQNGISNDRILLGLNSVYGWGIQDSSGEEWLGIGASTQLNQVVDDTGDPYVEFVQTLVIDIPISEQLGAYVEWFAFMPHHASSPNVGPQHYADSGFAYLVNDNMQLDIRIGFGLNDHADQLFTGVGGGFRW